ncbi:tryptophan halogenase family protein [Thalassotalea agariperforans]
MSTKAIKNIIIAGGGTAGWMSAAALSKLLGRQFNITLIESDEIGTVGVGEATIPTLVTFHRLLGINEQTFMRATNATFKLGINFENWKEPKHSYLHGFGRVGKECWAGEFQHFWLHGLRHGHHAGFEQYCPEVQAAKAGKFAITEENPLNYAYHLDATLYAKYLRKFSEDLGVTRQEGKITQVTKDPQSGDIRSLTLASGQVITGDLFIDCTGFASLLIEKTLHTGFEDWSHVLPCDSAVAVQTETVKEPIPYTRSIAHANGWQWQIPLQNRVGNGLVYCSKYLSDDDAKLLLLKNIEGTPLTEPRIIKYRTGKRRKAWNKNCVAVGLSSGFIEPLESTSIHLIMSSILRLIVLFPFEGQKQSLVDEYNQQFDQELAHVRDFIITHYKVTNRDDSEFWRHCQSMELPKSLAHRIQLFKDSARLQVAADELFHIDSWSQVMIGQGILPEQYHQIANVMPQAELDRFLTSLKNNVKFNVDRLPSHQTFINQYCLADHKSQ